jgi:hypothetical protein
MPSPTPLSHLSENAKADLVWTGILRDRYLVELQRTSDATAHLCVFDRARQMECLMMETVFCPVHFDSSSVFRWQNMVIDFLDERDLT